MSDTGDRFRNQSFPTPRAIGERTVSGFAWSRIRGAMMTAIDIERSATTSRERDARIDAIAAKCESDILAAMLSTAPTPRETGADIDRMTCPKCGYGGSAMHHDPSGDNWRICASCGADWDADPTPRPDAASASVTEIPRADLPKLDQPPESPGWRGDATVSAFRARLEVRIRETVDQVARVAGHAPGAKVNLKGFDSFLDCLCDAAAGAALAAAPREAGEEEVSDAEVEAADWWWMRDAADALLSALRGNSRARDEEETTRSRRARMRRALEAARDARRGATA